MIWQFSISTADGWHGRVTAQLLPRLAFRAPVPEGPPAGGGLPIIPLQQVDHGATEVARISFKGLQAKAAEGAAHRLGVPEQLAGRPGHQAHRVVTGL